MPPREPTSPRQHFQEAKPADFKSSGQFLYVDLFLKHGAGRRLDFTVVIPRGPHFSQFPVALTAMQTLLPLQADKGQGISTHTRTLAAQRAPGKDCVMHPGDNPQESGPTPRKIAIFPFPGQSVLKCLPSGKAFKNQGLLSYTFTQGDRGRRYPTSPSSCSSSSKAAGSQRSPSGDGERRMDGDMQPTQIL